MKNTARKFFTNSWTVTLVGTMLGVFAGIYVNGYYAERQLQRGHQQALDRIQEELTANQEEMQKSYDSLFYFYEPLNYLFSVLTEEGDLVMRQEEMQQFQQQYPGVLDLSDSTELPGGLFNYDGHFQINFINMLSIELSDVAWQTFKATSLSAVTEFECLYQLELTYKLQSKTIEEFEAWLNILGSLSEGREGRQQFTKQWREVLDYQEAILEVYPQSKVCN